MIYIWAFRDRIASINIRTELNVNFYASVFPVALCTLVFCERNRSDKESQYEVYYKA